MPECTNIIKLPKKETSLNPLQLPIKSFADMLTQISVEDAKEMLKVEESTYHRPRYIKLLEAKIDGHLAGNVHEDSEEGEISIENGKAFIVKDGKKEPYTATQLPEIALLDDSPERKKKAMELL